MARKKYTGTEKAPINVMRNEAAEIEKVQNGFSDILGFNPSSPFGVQLSQVDTIFKNNRWYLISNYRQLLSEIYVEHGLIQTIVDIPVDDGLRGGVDIKTKQATPEQIEKVESVMDREGDLIVVAQANKWNRLFGGAGVLILTGQEANQPINVKELGPGRPLGFRAVDMWELFFDLENTDGYNPAVQEFGFDFYSYYGDTIHKSRVMRMKGLTAPSFIRPRLRGWGFSIVESMVRSINQYLKATDLTFEVLDEFKVDVFKINGLTNSLMSSAGAEKIRRRVQLANAEKNYLNAITMDKEDDYDHKQLSFSGLAEVMEGIRSQLASDLRIPQTKLFGQSAAGFNSGEDDIENYNAMVESQVRSKIKYEILQMIELRFMNLFGFIPTDLSIDFKPLRILSAKDEQLVKDSIFNRVLAAKTANAINDLEFRDAVNKDDLLPIQLDTSDESINDLMDQASIDAGDDKPGADKDDKETVPVATGEKDDKAPSLDPNTPPDPLSAHPKEKV